MTNMRKLTLDIETLDVQSFPTTRDALNGIGTVRGLDAEADATNNPKKCGDTSIADNCETGLCTFQTCPATFDGGATCA
jgi:hypothetical protein